jgi:hypothetical protein
VPIARTDARTGTASSLTLTSTNVNDLIIVFAYNGGSTTIPSLVSGYTSIDTQSSVSNACRIAYKLSPGGETSTGTWTNATDMHAHVYSGHDINNPPSLAAATLGNSAVLSFAGATVHSKNDWVAGFAGAISSASGMNADTTGGTVLIHTTTSALRKQGFDTNAVAGGNTTASTLTVTGTGRWITEVVIIKAILSAGSLIVTRQAGNRAALF